MHITATTLHLFISVANNEKLKLGIMMAILILLITIIPMAMFFGSPGKFLFVNLDLSWSAPRFSWYLKSIIIVCNCNVNGTRLTNGDAISCNIYTGKCDCNVEYSGSKCNKCSLGHYDSDPDSSVLICEGNSFILK